MKIPNGYIPTPTSDDVVSDNRDILDKVERSISERSSATPVQRPVNNTVKAVSDDALSPADRLRQRLNALKGTSAQVNPTFVEVPSETKTFDTRGSRLQNMVQQPVYSEHPEPVGYTEHPDFSQHVVHQNPDPAPSVQAYDRVLDNIGAYEPADNTTVPVYGPVNNTYEPVNNTSVNAYEPANNTSVNAYDHVNNTSVNAYEPANNTSVNAYEHVNNTSVNAYEHVNNTSVHAYEPANNTNVRAYEPVNNTTVLAYEPVNNTTVSAYEQVNNTSVPAYEQVNNTSVPAYEHANNTGVPAYEPNNTNVPAYEQANVHEQTSNKLEEVRAWATEQQSRFETSVKPFEYESPEHVGDGGFEYGASHDTIKFQPLSDDDVEEIEDEPKGLFGRLKRGKSRKSKLTPPPFAVDYEDDEDVLDDEDLRTPYVIGGESAQIVEKASRGESFVSRNKLYIFGAAGLIGALIIGGLVGYSLRGDAKTEPTTTKTEVVASSSEEPVVEAADVTTVASSEDKDTPLKERLEAKLTETAEKSKLPYKIEIKDVAGGYLMGQIIYYPDDESKTYTDYSLVAPDEKVEESTDDKVVEIKEYLSSSLPTINEHITVKDGSKVAMETYDRTTDDGGTDGFITILLYENVPFGYVLTDSDMIHVNYVTTYYMSDVVAN